MLVTRERARLYENGFATIVYHRPIKIDWNSSLICISVVGYARLVSWSYSDPYLERDTASTASLSSSTTVSSFYDINRVFP
jgi:hypothetical protein